MSSRKDRVYIGVDPGAKGALCALNPAGQMMAFLGTQDPKIILGWLTNLQNQKDCRVIMIEDVHSLPGMSAKSNFQFGRAVERVNLLASLTDIPVELVQPKKWQKFIGVTAKGKAIKTDVADIASKLYPDTQHLLYGPRGGLLDGKSDALMVAHYAFKNFK